MAIFVAVALISVGLLSFRMGAWPWDHDEVASLVELRIIPPPTEGVGAGQLERLPRLVPVWYTLQSLMLKILPANEWGTRVLSVFAGVLAILLAFTVGWQTLGGWFASALAMMMGMSQCFVWLAQQNRFYTTAILFQIAAFTAVQSTSKRGGMMLIAAMGCGLLALFSHNLSLVIFGIALGAACAGYVLGFVQMHVVQRSAAIFAASVAVYLIYLRPLMGNWVSGGTGGTNEVVSFIAQLGMPAFALACFGGAVSIAEQDSRSNMRWWAMMAMGGLTFIAVSPLLLKSWNPRYAILFMLPYWWLAAFSVRWIADHLAEPKLACAWFAFIALLLVPKLASHYRDGSRHDFRAAATVAAKLSAGEEPIFCNWPMTIGYYLPPKSAPLVHAWSREAPAPDGSGIIIEGTNAFISPLTIPGRNCEFLAEFSRRRFDEQSFVVRVYRMSPKQ